MSLLRYGLGSAALTAAALLWLWRHRRHFDLRTTPEDSGDQCLPAATSAAPSDHGAKTRVASEHVQPEAPITPARLGAPKGPAPIADVEKIRKLLGLANTKKQCGNDALAAGKHAEALEFFEGALKALQYVIPPLSATSDATSDAEYLEAVAAARTLQATLRSAMC
jgi:hypothetical protein